VSEVTADPPKVWGVSEVNRAVKNLFERTLPDFWVGGEVGNWTRARSGHAYFTLKDERAQLRCVMWSRDAVRLPIEPDEGTRIRAFGSITLYEARGEYQFSARAIQAEGEEGLFRVAFEKLRGKLEAEGLLAPERKRRLPRFPVSVGVVTSTSGAAFHDIVTVIGRRAPWTRVVVRAARVQGEGAAAEIANAIRVLGASGEADLLIVGRGGGSMEDLWAFNEEPVARAIAECPVPVVSAVGHEVDVTIADLVADLRAPTPSAAAETVVPDRITIQELLAGVRPRLVRALRHGVERSERRIGGARERLVRAVAAMAAPRRRRLDRGADRLRTGALTLVAQSRARLETAAGKVDALSPLSTLRRGFAVPLGSDGEVLRTREALRRSRRFDLRLADGRVPCETRTDGPRADGPPTDDGSAGESDS
jgi:exodeoxyribonuclease VII large subunit